MQEWHAASCSFHRSIDMEYMSTYNDDTLNSLQYTVRAPVFGRHQFFGTSEHYRKAHGSLLSGWMNYNYTACCWFPTSSNILILPSQFWQIGFESCWLHCSKCRILVISRYPSLKFMILGDQNSGPCFFSYLDNSPPRTILHSVGIGPDEWFYWLVVVLVGSCPRDSGPGGQ